MNSRISALATIAGIAFAASAQAGFIVMDPADNGTQSVVVPPNGTITAVNDFKSALSGRGVTEMIIGGSLAVDTAGTIAVAYFGKEASFRNEFRFTGSGSPITFDTNMDDAVIDQRDDYFAQPNGYAVGTQTVGAGLLSFRFTAFNGATNVGTVFNYAASPGPNQASNDTRTVASTQSIGFWISADRNTAWLLWDDSGAGPNDNHDDMILRFTFRAAQVPEPATLGLLGLGLLGAAGAARRRRSRG